MFRRIFNVTDSELLSVNVDEQYRQNVAESAIYVLRRAVDVENYLLSTGAHDRSVDCLTANLTNISKGRVAHKLI